MELFVLGIGIGSYGEWVNIRLVEISFRLEIREVCYQE
jgi:hypothetical protein